MEASAPEVVTSVPNVHVVFQGSVERSSDIFSAIIQRSSLKSTVCPFTILGSEQGFWCGMMWQLLRSPLMEFPSQSSLSGTIYLSI